MTTFIRSPLAALPAIPLAFAAVYAVSQLAPEAPVPALAATAPTTQVPFLRNDGQLPAAQVAFYADTFHGATWVDRDGAIFHRLPATRDGNGWVIAEHIEGMSPRTPRGTDIAPASINHFLGASAGWVRHASAYNSLAWGEVLPGIELTARMQGSSVEKVFAVQAGALPGNIRIAVDGVQSMQVTARGELALETPRGTVHFSRPVAWQELGGERVPVSVEYHVDGLAYGFRPGAYDSSRPLFIDPLLSATYLGGSDLDPYDNFRNEVQIARDTATGDIVVAGTSRSTDFPVTAGALDETAGTICKAYIARLDGELGTLAAATWLGGSNDTCDTVNGLVLDAVGNVYLTGTANSQDFPTTVGAWDTVHSALYTDAYVARLSPALDELQASTFLGGSVTTGGGSSEYARAIALDASGNVFVAGTTVAADFPTTGGAMDTSMAVWCQDAYLAKFSADLTTLSAATFLGAAPADCISVSDRYMEVIDIAVDGSGNVIVAGRTNAQDYPVTSGSYGGGYNDALLIKVSADLSTRQAAVFLGGNDQDQPQAMTMAGGNIYLAGTTHSADFPATSGVLQQGAGGSINGFVARLGGDLALVAATYLGGGGSSANGVKDIKVVDDNLFLIVSDSGSSLTSWIPSTAWRPYKPVYGNEALLRLNTTLTSVTGGTWFGGNGVELLRLSPGGSGEVYVTGSANGMSSGVDVAVTSGAYDKTLDGAWRDVLIARLSTDLAGMPNITATTSSLNFGALNVPTATWPELTVTLTNTGTGWLRLGTPTLGGANAGSFAVDSSDCAGNGADLIPSGLLPVADQSCTLKVTFQPSTVAAGSYSATLQVPSNDPDQPLLAITLAGTTVASTGGGGTGGGGTGGGGSGGGSNGGAFGAPWLWLLAAGLAARRRGRRTGRVQARRADAGPC